MRLRHRLVVALLVTAVPLVAGLAWLRGELARRAGGEGVRHWVERRMEAGGRARCEADPARFGPVEEVFAPRGREAAGAAGADWRATRPRRVLEVFAYDAAYRARNPAAPAFPPRLRRALEAGEESASEPLARAQGPPQVEFGMRMPWAEGACALLLLRFERPPMSRADEVLWWGTGLVGVSLLAAVWFAAGPTVRRVQLLAEQVRRSAASRYVTPVALAGSDEIADLARAFNEAGAEVRAQIASLERREEALRTYLASTTHDLLLPLTGLHGHLAAIRRDLQQGRPVEAAGLVACEEETQYVAALLRNLAAIARLDSRAPLPPEGRVELGGLVERVAERQRPLAVLHGIELNVGLPPEPVHVRGDLTLLELLLGNLVHNAVRYNRRGGHVAVALERAGGERFALRVVDDGPGVPDGQLGRLGERGFRAEEARARHPGGLGLGLFIARSAAALHGFRLTLSRSAAGGLRAELEGETSAPGDAAAVRAPGAARP